MMSWNRRLGLAIALLIPIVALGAMTLLKNHLRQSGVIITLPIEGFDPRDLLSGHYLSYTVDYAAGDCPSNTDAAAVCIEPERSITAADAIPTPCTVYIIGSCATGRFEADIERFYIPEAYAGLLDQKVRNKQGALELSVNNNGKAVIRDLLIDGVSWQQAVTLPDNTP